MLEEVRRQRHLAHALGVEAFSYQPPVLFGVAGNELLDGLTLAPVCDQVRSLRRFIDTLDREADARQREMADVYGRFGSDVLGDSERPDDGGAGRRTKFV